MLLVGTERRAATRALRKKSLGVFSKLGDVMEELAEQLQQTVGGAPEDMVTVRQVALCGAAQVRLVLRRGPPHAGRVRADALRSASASVPCVGTRRRARRRPTGATTWCRRSGRWCRCLSRAATRFEGSMGEESACGRRS